MARRMPGEHIKTIRLPAMDDGIFDLDQVHGKRFMLSFFRFAACPFCNLRVHQLVKRYAEFGNNFTVIAIFDSSAENLRRHAARHRAPFPILADKTNHYYREYGIEHSVGGMLKGAITRLPSMLYAMFAKGYWPTSIGGSVTTMPADFLVDEQRVIHVAHYGRDEGDHLPFEAVKAFSLGANPGSHPPLAEHTDRAGHPSAIFPNR
jgi:peroxiredoxin Q/BCP